ncbi:uncharacterized protein N7469_001122 [Penicillium citrinum]|uniref:Uncharacterized protein n=1 Tax=Penicillium citrinum TaxID=5077 RepID=A0A9W9PDZ1_PENCI|nr:uncharacterized protein N7469_001122 [Penicillium citrinum]KAJ5242795.1 hypothetical protein N7469_001122 [Penicillium citrinum]
MAIWPFGRKNKRHTIQVSAEEADVLQTSLERAQDPPSTAAAAAAAADDAAEPTLGRKSSRRRSLRQANRLSRNTDGSESLRGSMRLSAHRPLSSLDQRTSEPEDRGKPDVHGHPRPPSRTGSLIKKSHQNGHPGPNKLRKSKRRTDEAIREREIKMLSSTPIDVPHRSGGLAGDYILEHRRRKANGRRADRYLSDISLSIRDSAASSLSDASDPYTYKVNAFAALTPRPVVRYVEAPRPTTMRSQTEPTALGRHDKNRMHTSNMSQEDLYYSRRRVNELADSLDASTLRELLDRDRRRREKKQIDDTERLHRKLQEQADAQQAESAREQGLEEKDNVNKPLEIEETQQPQPHAEAPVDSSVDAPPETYREHVVETIPEETSGTTPELQTESWARDESKAGEVVAGIESRRASLESANVTRNVDDSSVREPKLAPRPSFTPSHEMGMSRTTLSPSHSSIRHGVNSSHSQNYGVGSTSDVSDRRPSESSGHRNGGNTITSLFRRGSSRLKRRYRERFQESSTDVSNASHESFYKIQTQSSPPQSSSAAIPPRPFVQPTGIVKRSQSKFTEHFGDEPPMSPPDSRLQSPDIPEQVLESSLENEKEATFLHGPSPTPGMDIINPHKRRHQSWNDSIDAESDNVPLSQSLASIDSEGSWMSGQFFRRMSQKPSSPVRSHVNSFGASPVDGPADTQDDGRESIDSRSAMSNVMGEPELDDATAPSTKKPSEMWHHEVGRRPMIVTPSNRPKSNQGMLLKSIPSLSPISAEDGNSSEEETAPPTNVQRIASMHGEIGHIEQE